jgi:hypothetical protein
MGVPKESRVKVLDFWRWLDGKKTTIGALLDVLAVGLGGLLVWLPDFATALTGLGVNGAWIAGAVAVVGKGIIVLGLIHKVLKNVFGE